jgi:hypothetical protein
VTNRPKSGMRGECWPWPMFVAPNGYGRAARNEQAHRWVYERLRGPIPEGMTIDHLCRNRSCVNPWHLEPVTMRENTLRGTSISAINAAKTKCKRGHPFDSGNTRINRDGSRACRTCERERMRRVRRG